MTSRCKIDRTMTRALLTLASIAILSTSTLLAQSQQFALPMHNGAMTLDLTGYRIVQTSVKPQGRELGLRLHDSANTSALLFLFLTPENPHNSPTACRDAELQQTKSAMAASFKSVKLNPLGKDDNNHASMLISGKSADHLYSFSAAADQCLSIEVYPDRGTKLNIDQASTLIARQRYDPAYVPQSNDKFFYAELLYRERQYKAAAPIFANFLESLPADTTQKTQRRIATDEMGISLGASGDLAAAHDLFTSAIAKDPDYPMYYYNLACADAEQGHAKDAQHHLQQAFDRKANTLPGESLPDPTKDDSILKLKSDQAFWAFVQSLK